MNFRFLTILILASLLSSCGGKKSKVTEANIVILGGIASGIPGMTGGTKIYGYNFQTRETLNLTYNGQTSIQLSNGPWGFSAVTWDGDANGDLTPEGSVLEGKVYCGSTDMFLDGGDVAVNLSLSHAGCSDDFFGGLETKESDGQFKVFEPYKCVRDKNVYELDQVCDASIAQSYEIELSDKGGAPGLVSRCFTEATASTPEMVSTGSNLRIPIIGFFDNSFAIKIRLYDQAACGGDMKEYNIGNPYHGPQANFDDDNITQGDGNPNRLRIHVDPCAFANGKLPTPFAIPATGNRVLCTPAQFENIDSTDLAGTYELHRDLDFLSTNYPDSLVTGTFTGQLLGHGHRISNVQITVASKGATATGIFEEVDGDAINPTIQNLILENVRIDADESSAVGALVGRVQGGTRIERINATTLRIDATATTGSFFSIGGLIGEAAAGGGSTSEYNSLVVTDVNIDTETGYSNVGGLIGTLNDDNNLRMAKLNDIDIDTTSISADSNYGGVVGEVNGISVEVAGVFGRNIDIGSIAAPGASMSNIGTLAGKITDSRLFLNKVHGDLFADSVYVGGLAGKVLSSGNAAFSQNITDVDITNNTSAYTGGLFGELEGTTGTTDLIDNRSLGVILNCKERCGGLMGRLIANGGTINLSKSYSRSNVTSTFAGAGHIGGLIGSIGYVSGGINLFEVFYEGTVTATSATNVGGLIGTSSSAAILDSYSIASVSASSYGGLIGQLDGGSVQRAYTSGVGTAGAECIGSIINSGFTTDTFYESSSASDTDCNGNINAASILVLGNMPPLSAQTTIWKNVNNTTFPTFHWEHSLSKIGEEFTGTYFDPIILTTPAQWNAIGDQEFFLGKSYKLGADLNFGGANCGAGFNPIGSNTKAFHGNLSGNNFTIRNINCDETGGAAEPLGLFRKIGTDSAITEGAGSVVDMDLFDYTNQKALYIDNVSFITNVNNVGVLAGTVLDSGISGSGHEGRFSNQFSKIHVTNSSVTQNGAFRAGGLVGQMIITNEETFFHRSSYQGSINAGASALKTGGLFGEISGNLSGGASGDSVDFAILSFDGSFTSSASNVGGFAGIIDQDKIEIAYASVDVTGAIAGNNFIGGFVGDFQKGQIRNSYANADIAVSSNLGVAGGFAGFMTGTNGAEIHGSYVESSSVAAATGNASNAGCFLGQASISPIVYNNIADCANVNADSTSYLSVGGINLAANEKNVYVSNGDEARADGTWVTPTDFVDPDHMDSAATELVYGDPWFTSADGTPKLFWEVFPDSLNF